MAWQLSRMEDDREILDRQVDEVDEVGKVDKDDKVGEV